MTVLSILLAVNHLGKQQYMWEKKKCQWRPIAPKTVGRWSNREAHSTILKITSTEEWMNISRDLENQVIEMRSEQENLFKEIKISEHNLIIFKKTLVKNELRECSWWAAILIHICGIYFVMKPEFDLQESNTFCQEFILVCHHPGGSFEYWGHVISLTSKANVRQIVNLTH